MHRNCIAPDENQDAKCVCAWWRGSLFAFYCKHDVACADVASQRRRAPISAVETATLLEFMEVNVTVDKRAIGLTFEVRCGAACACAVVAVQPVLGGLAPQFGVKFGGVKYDAVLKRVKDSSPFVNRLHCGDRLVAINGRRVCDPAG